MSRLLALFAVALLTGCDSRPMATGEGAMRLSKEAAAPMAGMEPPPAAGAKPAAEPAVERRVIYSATVELHVTNVESVQPEV